MKSVVADPSLYDWEGDVPLKRPFAQTVIYELHMGGFPASARSGLPTETRGTYRGLIEKISLSAGARCDLSGILPVFQFDEQDVVSGHVNYWGYSPVSFFAPHVAYSSRKDHLGPIDEFRDMVKALHRAGIEIILDVVFDRTGGGTRPQARRSVIAASKTQQYTFWRRTDPAMPTIQAPGIP